MTYSESLSRIKRNVNPKFWNAEDIEHYNNIVNAIEKQMPKKPIVYKEYDTGRVVGYVCPKCNCDEIYSGIYRYDYCRDCGQAIDWSEVE
jgi:hypothetical protein